MKINLCVGPMSMNTINSINQFSKRYIQSPFNSEGFSLIELVVVVAVLAILSSIVRAVSSFKRPHGASTLTMQLGGLLDQGLRARKTGRSFLQKIVQARTAWSLERGWTKKEILEAVLKSYQFLQQYLKVVNPCQLQL